jgi:MFS family permease
MRWYLWMPAASASLLVLSMLVFLNTSQTLMFVFYFITIVCSASYMAPMVAITQSILPVHMRAQGTALLYLLLNLIGPGAGPLVAGILNDSLVGHYGAEAVRMSLTITLLGAVCGVVLVLHASRHLIADLTVANLAERTTKPGTPLTEAQ